MPNESKPFYGWKLVAAVFFIYLVNIAFPYYGGSLLNAFMAEELGLGRSQLGYGFSAFLLFVGLSSPLVGILVNRLGVRAVLTAGGATLTIGALMMATFTSSALQYYLFFGAPRRPKLELHHLTPDARQQVLHLCGEQQRYG